ncbi:MAG: hypothetical protein IJ515_01705 [Clostridia bacterium]|nr:hypothetical protein [Clostridia bacterium]
MPRIIKVGFEHKEAFESVCLLLSSAGLFNSGYQVNGDNTRIIGETHEYVLLSVENSTEASQSFGFNESGATWFKTLRGNSDDEKDDNAEWLSFKQEVQKEYHKKFSVVEYLPKKKDKAELEEAKRNAQAVAEAFFGVFYPELKNRPYSIVPQLNTNESDDLYGIAMRVDLASEVTQSAPMPFLCKIYFNCMQDTFKPMPASLAESLNQNILDLVPENDDGTAVAGSATNTKIIDLTLAELERLVDEISNDPRKNFADYICFSDEKDQESLKVLKKQMAHDNFALECQKIDCLYITHIKTEPYVCDLCINEIPMLRFSIGLNNTLSIRCMNCNAREYLINHNEITYTVDDETTRTVVINPEVEGFGLTEEQVAEIKEYSTMHNHLIEVHGLESIKASRGCSRVKCASQLISIDIGGGTLKTMCKDCPHPEVIWDGKYYTPSLDVATDKLELVPNDENLGTCNVCGRRFTDSILVAKKCPLCASLAKAPTDTKARARYRTYSGMLPLHTRVASLFAKKACVEDDEIIIFVLGSKRYIFNKLNAGDRGYLKPPSNTNKV